jgi:hypothetical protein
MSSQTVYFNNPADITALQQANTWSRGQFVSADLVYTVPANCWTGPLPGNVGPAQPVNVYKIVYYSSDSTTTSVQRVSGSLFVPAAGVSKTGSLVLHNKGLTPGNNTPYTSWETYSNTTLQAALTAASTNAGPKLNPTSSLSAGFNLFNPCNLAIWAGYGYIVCDADGFGLGVSQNDIVFNHMSQINPAIDYLRCLRNMYSSSVTAQRAVFNGAVYNANSFPITITGYSLGALYTPAIVNEFSAGVSAIIPSTEASKFLFKRGLIGAAGEGETIMSLIANENIGNYIINSSHAFLFSIALATNPALPTLSQPAALANYWTFWQDVDQKATILQDIAQIPTLALYSYESSPPTAPGTPGFYVPPTQFLGGIYGTTGVDFRQIVQPQYTGTVAKILKSNLGWTNPNRPLYTLPSCSFAHLYSTLDEVFLPFGPTGGANANYQQQAGYNFDSVAALDKYMGAGDVGTFYNFTGAGKTKTVTEVSFASDANIGITTATAAILAATTSTTGNNYLRIPVNLNNPATSALSSHSTFGGTYYATVIGAVLANLTNAN